MELLMCLGKKSDLQMDAHADLRESCETIPLPCQCHELTGCDGHKLASFGVRALCEQEKLPAGNGVSGTGKIEFVIKPVHSIA